MKQEKDGINHEFFYDSYALLAIVFGQTSYTPYTSGTKIVTTLMNLYEAYYILLQKNLVGEARQMFERFLPFCTPLHPHTIIDAANFRLINSRKKISYVDALGYSIAQQLHVHFLTGDDAFKDMPNVEFVK